MYYVRIDEIPVRGLKQIPITITQAHPWLVRIDEIPVRGLKPIISPAFTYPLGIRQNRRNPRQGIETYPIPLDYPGGDLWSE